MPNPRVKKGRPTVPNPKRSLLSFRADEREVFLLNQTAARLGRSTGWFLREVALRASRLDEAKLRRFLA